MDITTADWNAADWVIVGLVVVSTLVSLLRGFTREALSVAVWVLALLGGRVLSPALAALFIGTIENPELREQVAFICLFLAILIVGMLVAHMLAEAVRESALSFGDRVLGMAFGLARGILVAVALIAFSSTWLSTETWWQQSKLVPHLALLECWVRESAFSIAGWISG